jgi:hypothetical protein
MQPEQTPDNTKQPPHEQDTVSSRRSDAEPSLEHPEQIHSRDLEHHTPIALTFHNVSTATLDLLLAEMLPEIAPIASECLLQTVLNGETVPHTILHESYVDSTRYSFSQIRQFHLGKNGAEEISHRIIIERCSDEEPSVFELSLGNTNPRSADFTIAYSWMDESERWDNVNAWGALLGVESISSLFANTPAELFESDEQGLCTSLLASDISVRTQPVSPRPEPRTSLTTVAGTAAHWAPRGIQLSAPLYGEQAAIMRLISPTLEELLVKTGLLPTLDAFGARDLDLQKRLLDRAAARLDHDIRIQFSRLVHIGPEESHEFNDSEDSYSAESFDDDSCAGIGSRAEDDETLTHGTEESSDGEKVPFSPNPLEGLPVSSGASVNLLHKQLGSIRLDFFSTAQPRGMVLLGAPERFNFAPPTVGITFLNESPSLRELANRWRALREIARIGGVSASRKDLEANLFYSSSAPHGGLVSADIGAHRVLMAFDPPSNATVERQVSEDS